MKQLWILMGKDIREALRSRATYFYTLFLFALSLPYMDGLRTAIGQISGQGAGTEALREAIRAFLSGAVYSMPLVLTVLMCSVFAAYSIILEKTRRTLESLLATPLSLRQVWLAKSLAVTIPSVVIAYFVLLVSMTGLNLIVIRPVAGTLILPDTTALASALLIIPVMTFLVVTLVSFFQMTTSNPRLANFAFTGIFLLIYLATITDLTASLNFSVIYLAITVVLAAVNLFLVRFLSKERVVLSGKG